MRGVLITVITLSLVVCITSIPPPVWPATWSSQWRFVYSDNGSYIDGTLVCLLFFNINITTSSSPSPSPSHLSLNRILFPIQSLMNIQGGDWYYDATTNQLRQDNYHECDAIQKGMLSSLVSPSFSFCFHRCTILPFPSAF